MEKQKSIHFAIIGVLAFAVLFMSVGFATYSQVLDLNGTNFSSEKQYFVSLDADSYQLGEGSVKAESLTISDDRFDVAVHFDKAGQYYLASLDVINTGDYNAILDTIRMPSYEGSDESYIKYTVTFDNDQVFTGSESEIAAAINHDAGSNVKNIMIKISYEPEEGTVVPEEGVDVSTFAEFEFVQAV